MKQADDELLTDRLRLLRLEERDAGLMLAIWNDPDFVRFVGDRGIRTEQEALEALPVTWDEGANASVSSASSVSATRMSASWRLEVIG